MKRVLMLIMSFCMFFTFNSFSAKIINKEDASLFSKASKYSTSIDKNLIEAQTLGKTITNEDIERFSVPKVKTDGNKYTNQWSNYSISFDDKIVVAHDYYDFNTEGIQYDFGVSFKDYSRLAVYYSTLSRPIEQIAKKFAPNSRINNVVVGGEVYKHVQLDEQYPYGILKYDYYLRNVDNKLMVIECFHEKDSDVAPTYISKFVKNS